MFQNNSKFVEMSADCESQVYASQLLIHTKIVNIFSTIIIIIIGLIGNSLAVFVFAQKRFRLHSSSIYLLCLAVSDGIFLLIHFFEDTLRTYIDVYINIESDIDPICYTSHLNHTNNSENLLRTLNITDQFDFSCRIVNYFRYFLRFISAYIIVSFTIQRAIAIYSPFYQAKFESKQITWAIVSFIILVSALINLWVPIFFNLRVKLDGAVNVGYCDVNKEYSMYYFRITIIYIFLIMLIPIIIIFFCNILVIRNTIQANKKRADMSNANLIKMDKLEKTSQSSVDRLNFNEKYSNINYERKMSNASSKNFQEMKTFKNLLNQVNNKQNAARKTNDSQKKITRMLLLMSFSYAILNLPYFISWSMFFLRVAFSEKMTLVERFHVFSILNVCEIFYILNYSVHFFIYCAAGKRFRAQLRDAFSHK